MGEALEQEGRRKRAFKPKTRTGCLTCRIRRIKCDEAKPHCLKCTSTGRKCDGYIVAANDRITRSQSPHPLVNSSVAQHPLSRQIIIPFQGSILERRGFQYFQEETIPQICGFYREKFWFQSVLQACHHNPAIRHAAIALGSLHEQYSAVLPTISKDSQDTEIGGFALQQYNKAIQSLLKPIPGSFCKPEKRVDVALISCILFACFDAFRGHLGTVFEHIDGGARILSELQKKENSDSSNDGDWSDVSLYAPMSTLKVMFSRLDIQGSSLLGSRRLRLVPESSRGPSIEELYMPQTFYSFEDARNAQDAIFRCWHHDFRRTLTNGAELPFAEAPVGEEALYLKTTFAQKLQQWSETYENFLCANPGNRNVPADHLLRVNQIFIHIHVDLDHAASAEDETVWDHYNPEYKQILQHARFIIASTAPITQRRPIFSLDTLINTPLYMVASRCRHPEIRRDAIAYLHVANRQEGLWESRTLARVAQRAMEIEEEGIVGLVDGTEIPNWKRVWSVHPHLDPDGRKAVIHYTSIPAEEGGLPLTNMKEEIEW